MRRRVARADDFLHQHQRRRHHRAAGLAGVEEVLLIDLLRRVKDGGVSPEDALERLKSLPFEDIEFAKIDHHRALRRGFPEVIYAPVDIEIASGTIAREPAA